MRQDADGNFERKDRLYDPVELKEWADRRVHELRGSLPASEHRVEDDHSDDRVVEKGVDRDAFTISDHVYAAALG